MKLNIIILKHTVRDLIFGLLLLLISSNINIFFSQKINLIASITLFYEFIILYLTRFLVFLLTRSKYNNLVIWLFFFIIPCILLFFFIYDFIIIYELKFGLLMGLRLIISFIPLQIIFYLKFVKLYNIPDRSDLQ